MTEIPSTSLETFILDSSEKIKLVASIVSQLVEAVLDGKDTTKIRISKKLARNFQILNRGRKIKIDISTHREAHGYDALIVFYREKVNEILGKLSIESYWAVYSPKQFIEDAISHTQTHVLSPARVESIRKKEAGSNMTSEEIADFLKWWKNEKVRQDLYTIFWLYLDIWEMGEKWIKSLKRIIKSEESKKNYHNLEDNSITWETYLSLKDTARIVAESPEGKRAGFSFHDFTAQAIEVIDTIEGKLKKIHPEKKKIKEKKERNKVSWRDRVQQIKKASKKL